MTATGITNFVSSNASWIHSQIEQLPFVGPTYSWITANIGSPFLNLVCKVRDFTMAYFFRPAGRFFVSVFNNYPWTSRFVIVMLAIFTIRAVIHKVNSDKKTKTDQ